MKGILAFAFCLLAVPAIAAPWTFDSPVDVTTAHGEKIFHHLESAGRKSIAVSRGVVAVAWEDSRTGDERSYVALKRPKEDHFAPDVQVSGAGEAYEPVVTGLDGGRFAVAWEEDGMVWVKTVGLDGSSPAVKVAGSGAAQITLAFSPKVGLYAAWAQKAGPYTRVMVARIAPGKGVAAPQPEQGYSVDIAPPRGDQQYPSLAVWNDGSLTVAWEDRRDGHTLIMGSHSADGKKFPVPMQLNETHSGNGAARSLGLGRGTGAMRVALANVEKQGLAVVWSDKRDFLSGYDVYADFSKDQGASFGPNQMVQDSFGDNMAQWHPAVAANASGKVAVVWDDERDGTADIWLAWPVANGWSDNLAVPGASGPGVQTDPAIAMDDEGNVHVAWLQKAHINGTSSIRYVMGRATAPEK